MQEIRTAVVQQVTPSVRVRIWADDDDVPVAVKSADYTPTVGDKVALIKLGTRDGWCISHKVDGATVRPDVEQNGIATGTSGAGGQITVVFPLPFAEVPVVTANAFSGNDRIAVPLTATTSQVEFIYRTISTGATLDTTYNLHWRATGPLAVTE